ncbi:unnamed protein product [Sphagnum troendelagicum]|uniref:Uncharacterized protein n=1 Tax=Sphagnum troendelagicum TaxID=128251 RepID=A0ABP0TK86_9BRYO
MAQRTRHKLHRQLQLFLSPLNSSRDGLLFLLLRPFFSSFFRGLLGFSFFFVFFWTLFVAGAVEAQETNPVDKQALFELMYSINYENDWLSYYPDPCMGGPQGIVCEPDAVTGVYYVTQLEFGFISPITSIIPCSNNATIPPASIAKFTHLDTVAFYNCFMDTNNTVTIPSEIGQLGPTLRLLSFTGNTGLVGGIPPELGALTGLKRLVLVENGLQESIPQELGNLTSLTQLDVSHNSLTGQIPGSLAGLRNLVNLDMRYNRLDGVFPLAFGSGFPALQRLALSYNQLQGSLPDMFTDLPALSLLDLSFNNFSGTLPPTLGSLSNLQDLFLSANGIGGEIPSSLGALQNLVILDLSWSNYSGTIPSSFKNLQNLRYLGLSNNRLTGTIPASLASLPYIFTLNLEANDLSGPLPFPISFVQKMGQNLVVRGNPGLCYNSQMVNMGVEPCSNNSSLTNASAPSSVSPSASSPQHGRNPSIFLTLAFLISFLYTVLCIL